MSQCRFCANDATMIMQKGEHLDLVCSQRCVEKVYPGVEMQTQKSITDTKVDKNHILHSFIKVNPWISAVLGIERNGVVQNKDALECLNKHVQQIAGKRGMDETDDEMDTEQAPRSGPVQVTPSDSGFTFYNPLVQPTVPYAYPSFPVSGGASMVAPPPTTAAADVASSSSSQGTARLYSDQLEQEQSETRKRLATNRFELPIEVVNQLLETLNDTGVLQMMDHSSLSNLALMYASRRDTFLKMIKNQNHALGMKRVLYELTKQRLPTSLMQTPEQVRLSRVAAIFLLLGAGIPADFVDTGSQKTPLHWAAFHGYASVIPGMIKNGASLEATDKHGFTPMRYALLNNQKETEIALIFAAAST